MQKERLICEHTHTHTHIQPPCFFQWTLYLLVITIDKRNHTLFLNDQHTQTQLKYRESCDTDGKRGRSKEKYKKN